MSETVHSSTSIGSGRSARPVVICDTQPLFAHSLAAAFEHTGHPVAAVAADLDEAVAAVRACEAGSCIVDVAGRVVEALEAIAAIRAESPGTTVLVLSAHVPDDLAAAAVAAGASRCLPKTASLGDVLDAVVDGAVAPASALPSRDAWQSHPLARFLTPREREVLVALARAESTQALARRLGLRPATVRTHVHSVLSKLGAHTRLEAVALARADGLVATSRFEADRHLVAN